MLQKSGDNHQLGEKHLLKISGKSYQPPLVYDLIHIYSISSMGFTLRFHGFIIFKIITYIHSSKMTSIKSRLGLIGLAVLAKLEDAVFVEVT